MKKETLLLHTGRDPKKNHGIVNPPVYHASTVTFPTLALGGKITIQTLDGEEAYTVPEGTEAGATFRLKGRGMPDVNRRGEGDLLITLKAITPKKLTKEQKKLLEQLAATLPPQQFEPTPREEHDDKGIFDRVKDIFG